MSDGPRLTTGNLSVDVITHSAIGARPDPNYTPSIPSIEALRELKDQGLWGYEDYIAWGVVEPAENRWDWSHHDEVCRRVTAAGLVYIPYIWCHYPPIWLRDDDRITLMRSGNGGNICYMLSIYDPRTLDWYRRFYEALKAHFGDRLTEVYACFLGPFAEGNYPLPYANFVVDVGDCPDGQYWCGDRFALPLFQAAMRKKYGSIAVLNAAWRAELGEFAAITFPPEIAGGGPAQKGLARPVAQRRRWLDFIHWYHQTLIDFCAGSVDCVVEVFGRERVAAKPGGNCGGMNPVSWGTYNPGFAKMAGAKRIALQSADSHGAYWADKWTSSAYAFYGVPYRTEAAGGLTTEAFIQRTFSDVSCGASRLFSYELDKHMSTCVRYLPLFTGERGQTDVALLAPTTLHYLGGDVAPAIAAGMHLRDYFDYDVLDELLIEDGALERGHYRVLIAAHCPVVEAHILERIRRWNERGGLLIWAMAEPVQTVEGNTDLWINTATFEGDRLGKGWMFGTGPDTESLAAVAGRVVYHSDTLLGGPQPMPLVDGQGDSVWTTVRTHELLFLNVGTETVEKKVPSNASPIELTLPPRSIVVTTRQ
ncbi:MAG TPA: family 14 glycosylhydrolase [Candidatus Hydrogenedentes bacterium]|nr:family 14 glycosylhydrolase [Candidatus Hydrogenedentota bacterium]